MRKGKAFRAKEAEAFTARKLGLFPCLSQNSCSGVLLAPFFQAGGEKGRNLFQS